MDASKKPTFKMADDVRIVEVLDDEPETKVLEPKDFERLVLETKVLEAASGTAALVPAQTEVSALIEPGTDKKGASSPSAFTVVDAATSGMLVICAILVMALSFVYTLPQDLHKILAFMYSILMLGTIVGPHTIWFRDIEDRISRLKNKTPRKARLNKLCAIHPILISLCVSILSAATVVLNHGPMPIVAASLGLAAIGFAIKWFCQLLILPGEVYDIAKHSAGVSSKDRQTALRAAIGVGLFSLFPIVGPMTMMIGGPITTVLSHPLALLLSVFATGASFYVLRKKLIQIEPSASAMAYAPNRGFEPSVGDVQFQYNHFVEITKFIKTKVAMRSPWKLGVLLLILVAAIGSNLHNVILNWIVQIMAGNGVATQGLGLTSTQLANPLSNLNALANSGLVFAFVVLTGLAMVLGLRSYVRAPKRFVIGKKGVNLIYWKDSGLKNASLDWSEMKQIKLVRPSGKASALSDRLIFERHIGAPISIKLAGLGSSTEKEKLLAAIDRYGPEVSRDAIVEETLRKPLEHNYTELWLQALAAPPKRERLKPMIGGAMLNEGRFQIDREIGVGGQGFAYLAQDKRSDEGVVLKEFVLPVFVDINARRQSLENFEKEAKLLSSLEHPQVVKLEGFFVEDHRAYLVLEHIDGENLRQIVERDGPMPEERIRELAGQMCAILTYLHGLSPPLVHRDFTPDNLILRRDGTLKLIDFNVAQQVEVAVTGTVVGKQSYLPPEQFRGQAVPASDLYAFGATLYFLAGGQDPTPISVAKPIKDGLPVSAELDHLITSLTQMEAAMRPASAQEVAETLATKETVSGVDGQS